MVVRAAADGAEVAPHSCFRLARGKQTLSGLPSIDVMGHLRCVSACDWFSLRPFCSECLMVCMCKRLDGDLRTNKLVELNSSMTSGHETRVQWRNKPGQRHVPPPGALWFLFFF